MKRTRLTMDQRTVERITREFPSSTQVAVTEALNSYAGPETERVQWDILELSKGSLAQVRHFLKAAQTDYRDILYWAEYYATDPMLTGADPKKMVEELLEKWGQGSRPS